MVAKVYDMMLCQDGVTRAVEVVDGSPVDPSYVNQWKKPKEEKKEKPKVNILILNMKNGWKIMLTKRQNSIKIQNIQNGSLIHQNIQ